MGFEVFLHGLEEVVVVVVVRVVVEHGGSGGGFEGFGRGVWDGEEEEVVGGEH